MDKDLQKAERAYDKAWANLINERNRVFPIGSKVILSGISRTVTNGSLYADQIFLDSKMHAGFNHVIKDTNK